MPCARAHVNQGVAILTRGNMGPFCGKQLLVCKFELDAVGFFKTKFTGE
jgi:hypothetical protein